MTRSVILRYKFSLNSGLLIILAASLGRSLASFVHFNKGRIIERQSADVEPNALGLLEKVFGSVGDSVDFDEAYPRRCNGG